MEEQPRFGLIVVGDEILSGKRADKHFAKVLELLGARGLRLEWAHYLPDDRARLVDALRASFAGADHVFSCGGIGSTPDDHTRQAAAEALGLELALHPEAARFIEARCRELAAQGLGSDDMDTPENRQRLKMGQFPVGAEIIPNPYNRIAGFAIRRHWFVPGFPVMAWPMIEWVLDTHCAHLFGQAPRLEKAVLVFEIAESTLTPLMERIEQEFPLVKVFSLPSVGDANTRRHIELGVKGEPVQVEAAFASMLGALDQMGAEYSCV
jgi:molybdopterin-biosynthesis enzyme MoeA-like protein